ncbi:hypothetical protein GUJ93_ZPchr0004g38891 [Zizania palustris]|uniref:Uncharacterized protein n=2 Tax=Zizania palustris TaxID=103762 RepID=A0A8J5VNS6_ZIZPA|nr:hypothetical protein GUJ93_ZPchr0004g38891 [Zizania palustris]
MGCFLACFGDGRRRRKPRRQSPARSSPRPDHVALHGKTSASAAVYVGVEEEASRPPLHEAKALLSGSPLPAPPVAEVVVIGASPSKELRELNEHKISSASPPMPEKQVTAAPLSLVTCPPVVAAVVSPDPELRMAGEQESHSSGKKKVTFDMNVMAYENVTLAEHGAGKYMQKEVLFPENHRYRNCSDSEEEDCAEVDYYGDDSDEKDEDFVDCRNDLIHEEMYNEESKQESHESLFSLPTSKDHPNDNEVSSPAPKSSGTSVEEQSPLIQKNNPRDRSQYVCPVLNPVQNLYQWKEVKVQAVPARKLDKENVKSVPNVGASPGNYSKREVSVDASLSTWLVSSDNSTVDKVQGRSPRSVSTVSRDERPILGALTVDDLKRSSATSSPQRSPSNNREDAPIVGTVGSYWSCTKPDNAHCSSRSDSETNGIPNTISKYREVHSTLKVNLS